MTPMDSMSHPFQKVPVVDGDTTLDAEAMHRQVLRRLGVSGRARMVFELSDGVRAASEAGVRLRHPEYDARQVRLAAIRLSIGDRLFRLAFPHQDVQP
jgi:hypothetical protein